MTHNFRSAGIFLHLYKLVEIETQFKGIEFPLYKGSNYNAKLPGNFKYIVSTVIVRLYDL